MTLLLCSSVLKVCLRDNSWLVTALYDAVNSHISVDEHEDLQDCLLQLETLQDQKLLRCFLWDRTALLSYENAVLLPGMEYWLFFVFKDNLYICFHSIPADSLWMNPHSPQCQAWWSTCSCCFSILCADTAVSLIQTILVQNIPHQLTEELKYFHVI